LSGLFFIFINFFYYFRKEVNSMKVAVFGSPKLRFDKWEQYMPAKTSALLSCGVKGVDQSAREYAKANNIPVKIFHADYRIDGQFAQSVRNKCVIVCSDLVLGYWQDECIQKDFIIKQCLRLDVKFILIEEPEISLSVDFREIFHYSVFS
jgi:hypothetical protein